MTSSALRSPTTSSSTSALVRLTKRCASPGPGREAGAHAGFEDLRAGVGLQHDLALEHPDELVLRAVGVAIGGLPAGDDAGEVHPEVPQAGVVAETAIVARSGSARAAAREWSWRCSPARRPDRRPAMWVWRTAWLRHPRCVGRNAASAAVRLGQAANANRSLPSPGCAWRRARISAPAASPRRRTCACAPASRRWSPSGTSGRRGARRSWRESRRPPPCPPSCR